MRTESGHLCHHAAIGQRCRAIMPHSEVCMHMGVADQYMDFEVIEGGNAGDRNPFIQLYVTHSDVERYSQVFSAPITSGEGGLYPASELMRSAGWDGYYYPHSLNEPELRDTGKFDELGDTETA